MSNLKTQSRILIVANWKMNPSTLGEAQRLFAAVGKGVNDIADVQVVVCPPFIFIPEIVRAASSFARPETSYGGSSVAFGVGGQDCFWEDKGAFTGEISPIMLKNLACSYVILGHSERKKYLGETLEMINKKIKAALAAGLTPVVCVGEHIEQDLEEILKDLNENDLARSVFVYEPEWAISTAKNAKPESPEHVKEAIAKIKEFAGSNIPVLYGGSTNSKNIRSFVECGGQGALVGAASLDAEEFIALVKNAVVS